MNHDEGQQIAQLKHRVERLEDKIDNLTAHLVGDMTKPGTLRVQERMHQDMYGEDGVIQTIQTYKSDRRWILGAAAGISFGAGAIGAWLKGLFGKQ